MRITNDQGLPQAIVDAVDTFHRGGDYSASMLTKSPRQVWLERRHDDEMVQDVSEMVWALFGTAVHFIIQRGDNENRLTEEYLTAEVAGKRLSGFCDVYEDGEIADWKTTSVWSYIFMDNEKRFEYESQLNAYAYLFRKYGFKVHKLTIVMLFRDWQKSKAKYDPQYPQSQVQKMDIKLWSVDEQERYLTERIQMFEQYKDTPDEQLPYCSLSYRWATPSKWALMKDGRKSAIKLYETEAEALNASKDDNKLYVQERPGEQYKRCEYCNARPWCNQYQEAHGDTDSDES